MWHRVEQRGGVIEQLNKDVGELHPNKQGVSVYDIQLDQGDGLPNLSRRSL